MKKILILTCTLFLLAVDALAQSIGTAPTPSDWKRYTVKGEEFSITLPTVPAMATDKLKFIPAAKDGKFVSTSQQIEYYFNLY